MHYLIDIDDTICVTTPRWMELTLDYMRKHKFKRIRGKSKDTYHIEDSFRISLESKQKWLAYMYDEIHFENLEPVDGAVEFVKKLYEAGDIITFVTARLPFTEKMTLEWLKKHFSFIKDIQLILEFSEQKGCRMQAICNSFKAEVLDVLIDNSEMRCRAVQDAGGRAILFTGVQVDTTEDSDISTLQKAENFEKVLEIIKEMK